MTLTDTEVKVLLDRTRKYPLEVRVAAKLHLAGITSTACWAQDLTGGDPYINNIGGIILDFEKGSRKLPPKKVLVLC